MQHSDTVLELLTQLTDTALELPAQCSEAALELLIQRSEQHNIFNVVKPKLTILITNQIEA